MYQITLRAARVNRGMTLEKVAKEVKRSAKTISKYEEDSTKIPRGLFLLLVKLYDVPESMVYCGKESVFIGFNRNYRKKRNVS
ncbi:helix-turn-helix transcriptional regulator [Paenibacillus sp. FSL R5-0527]|uniref:XRE family transcriptional regulator n=1 Tax=Paenibacillus oralis TaxID=2490856 RepID=A0A3P3TYM1_9BACL|nr:helix-turn-helix transcriptional regulator [Paenibacillus oralis]OMG45665.1 hypothetical protein BK140_31020 [Paenibacillus macerans]RRJ62449.1 XRE family transcriptional regulator [Paenibacillus oralis]